MISGRSRVGDRCYAASSAAVFADALHLGDDSYIAAHAYVTGAVVTGSDCTLNPFTVVRGRVTLGNGVRIGAHTSLLGFNHLTAPETPVFEQPHTSCGIAVGDDVWIGSHVVVLDGVTIGGHSVIGAGAVVTKDVPSWTVAVGNPARPLRDRRDATGGPRRPGAEPSDPTGDLSQFADRVRAQSAEVLGRCWDGERFVDRPGAPAPTVRAHCDAVEIADLIFGGPPPQLTADEHIGALSATQDPGSGLVPELGQPRLQPYRDGFLDEGGALYHVLAVGYALDLLGASFPHPVRGVQEMSAQRLVERLDALPWRNDTWGAGAWIDSWATAAHWNQRYAQWDRSEQEGVPGALEALFGWLIRRTDRDSGMRGHPLAGGGQLQVVNGYYRATRGSFAQFGLPVRYPHAVVDTVLEHGRDARHFAVGRQNACNVLDVAHPLWLCTDQLRDRGEGGYRRTEMHVWAERQLRAVLPRWQDGQGFGFGTGADSSGSAPGLQGTEMWLAVIWLLADLLGRSDALGYRHPRHPPPRTGTREALTCRLTSRSSCIDWRRRSEGNSQMVGNKEVAREAGVSEDVQLIVTETAGRSGRVGGGVGARLISDRVRGRVLGARSRRRRRSAR